MHVSLFIALDVSPPPPPTLGTGKTLWTIFPEFLDFAQLFPCHLKWWLLAVVSIQWIKLVKQSSLVPISEGGKPPEKREWHNSVLCWVYLFFQWIFSFLKLCFSCIHPHLYFTWPFSRLRFHCFYLANSLKQNMNASNPVLKLVWNWGRGGNPPSNCAPLTYGQGGRSIYVEIRKAVFPTYFTFILKGSRESVSSESSQPCARKMSLENKPQTAGRCRVRSLAWHQIWPKGKYWKGRSLENSLVPYICGTWPLALEKHRGVTGGGKKLPRVHSISPLFFETAHSRVPRCLIRVCHCF